MRPLRTPNLSAEVVLSLCMRGIADEATRQRFGDAIHVVNDSETNYQAAGLDAQLYTLPRTEAVGPLLKSEMVDLYTLGMTRTNSPGRLAYDAIRVGANTCPLCGVGVVATLDHYLPKHKYPGFAVTPVNLLPSCFDCNRAKSTRHPINMGDQTLHPYFDDFTDDEWLGCSLAAFDPATPQFYIRDMPTWNPDKTQRCITHFRVFKLASLYGINSANELTNIRGHLSSLHAAGGFAAVRSHLLECYQSRVRTWRNSWQSALYRALSESDEFCEGGFQAIPTVT